MRVIPTVRSRWSSQRCGWSRRRTPGRYRASSLHGRLRAQVFDYRCGYCRRVKPTLETLLAENDDLRLVYKEFPILGPESTAAAHAALAARNQGRLPPASVQGLNSGKGAPPLRIGNRSLAAARCNYEAFHWALMEADGPFDLDHILAVARSVGLDDERLARDMEEPALDALPSM